MTVSQKEGPASERAPAAGYAVLGVLFVGTCLYLYFAPVPPRPPIPPGSDGWGVLEIRPRDLLEPIIFFTFPMLSAACLIKALQLVMPAKSNQP